LTLTLTLKLLDYSNIQSLLLKSVFLALIETASFCLFFLEAKDTVESGK